MGFIRSIKKFLMIEGAYNENKKALLIGINKYRDGNNLNGCVNDVENMRAILLNKYHFNPKNIKIILDYDATFINIVNGLKWLVTNNSAGDELLFHYSGHGSQIIDKDKDEEDGYDEILCPTNMNWDDPLSDDILSAIFAKILPSVYFTFTCDSCHSGTITRSIRRNRFLMPPYNTKNRKCLNILPKAMIDNNHIMISGCKENQTSADAYMEDQYQGAFTWALIKVLREDPNITIEKLHRKIRLELFTEGFDQIPQLVASLNMTKRKFLGGVE